MKATRANLLRVGVVLSITSLSFGQAIAQGKLNCNDVRNESLGRGEQHIYTLEAVAGDVVSLVLYRTSGENDYFIPLATVYGPPGIDDSPLPGNIGRSGPWFIGAQETGTYTIRVSDENMFETGTYVLGIHWLWPGAQWCGATDILCRESVYRNLDRRADEQYFRLQVTAGDRITFALNKVWGENDYFIPVLDLLGPSSATALFNSRNGIIDFVAELTGEYGLRVRDENQFEVGGYVLTVQRLAPICDCNSNGVADDADIANGTSRDDDDNLAPDECQNGAWFWLEDAGAGSVKLMMYDRVPVRGGEIALRYDSSEITITNVQKGAGIPAASRLEWEANLSTTACPVDSTVNRGLVAGWVNPETANDFTPIGAHEVLKISFTAAAGTGSPLKFVSSCLGITQARGLNVVTSLGGNTLSAVTQDFNVCLPVGTFRRGDANNDGKFDISDPVAILICRFVDASLCRPCEDANDANDDGQVNITDPIYLLNWRFNGGPQPPAPFPGLGADPTADSLAACSYGGCN